MAEDTTASLATSESVSATHPAALSVPAHNWGWFMLRGVLAILLGIAAIFFPLSALLAFTLLFAAYAFVDGIASLVAGVKGARAGERWGALVFRGIVGFVVGVLFVVMPFVATATYALLTVAMLAAWGIAGGVFDIWAAIRLRREIRGEWLLGLSGAISIALGIALIVLIMPNPAATILSAAWLIAIFLLLSGAVLIAQALRLRSLREARV